MKAHKRLAALTVIFAFALLIPSLACALPFTYTAAGTGTEGEAISASAEFDFVSHNFGYGSVDALQITLTNTSMTTSYRGNLLTGIFFSLTGVGSLSTSSYGFDGLAPTVRTSNTTSITNKDIAPAVNNRSTDGAYQLSNGPFGISNSGYSYSAYDYGIATVGFGLTGFSGNATEGDNYGIAAAGTDLTLSSLYKALPVIDTSAVFWILRPESLIGLDQITNAAFAFGSQPDHGLEASSNPVPEPATMLLLGSGLSGLAYFRRRLRKK